MWSARKTSFRFCPSISTPGGVALGLRRSTLGGFHANTTCRNNGGSAVAVHSGLGAGAELSLVRAICPRRVVQLRLRDHTTMHGRNQRQRRLLRREPDVPSGLGQRATAPQSPPVIRPIA